jgi:hypothetical protein
MFSGYVWQIVAPANAWATFEAIQILCTQTARLAILPDDLQQDLDTDCRAVGYRSSRCRQAAYRQRFRKRFRAVAA